MNKLSYKRQRQIIIVAFLFVPLLLLAVFSYYPALTLVKLSFTSWNGISPTQKWIGLDNYKTIFTNESLYKPFLNNLIYLAMGFVQIALALYFAVVLNAKMRGKNIFKAILFMPYIINSVAIVFIFNNFFNFQYGALNELLRMLGLDGMALNWLGDPKLVNLTMAFMNSWKYMGFTMVIFLGALQSIPKDIYEAASIDGANSIQSFLHITMPSIKSIVKLTLFLNLNGAVSTFEFPFIIYPLGSPFDMSETFMTKTMATAFRFSDYGLASAMGIVLMIIIVVLLFIQSTLLLKGDKDV